MDQKRWAFWAGLPQRLSKCGTSGVYTLVWECLNVKHTSAGTGATPRGGVLFPMIHPNGAKMTLGNCPELILATHVRSATRTNVSIFAGNKLGGFGLRENGGENRFESMGQAGQNTQMVPKWPSAGQLAGTDFGNTTRKTFLSFSPRTNCSLHILHGAHNNTG